MEDGARMMDEGRYIKETEESEDHDHASDTPSIVSEHFKPHIIFVGRRGDEEKNSTYQNNHSRFARPSDKSIKMASYPGSNVKKQEKPPRRNTQETKHIEYYTLHS